MKRFVKSQRECYKNVFIVINLQVIVKRLLGLSKEKFKVECSLTVTPETAEGIRQDYTSYLQHLREQKKVPFKARNMNCIPQSRVGRQRIISCASGWTRNVGEGGIYLRDLQAGLSPPSVRIYEIL